MTEDCIYDIAFSFLEADVATATKLNDILKKELKTFIYTERQKELALSNGAVAFSEIFSKQARMVVVLHRNEWGKTSWTRVEATAIENRGLRSGFDFVKIVAMEDRPEPPAWYPRTHLYYDISKYPLEMCAAVIKDRCRELGSIPYEETPVEHASRLAKQDKWDKKRKGILYSDYGVENFKSNFIDIANALLEEMRLVNDAFDGLAKFDMAHDSQEIKLTGKGRTWLSIRERLFSGGSTQDAEIVANILARDPHSKNGFREIRKWTFELDFTEAEEFRLKEPASSLLHTPKTVASMLLNAYIE